MILDKSLKELILELYKIQGVKFGAFTLKSGLISPIYFDLRVIVSHPNVLKMVSSLVGVEVEVAQKGGGDEGEFVICGVPYTALPVATLISVQNNVPMLLKRKEAKSYGTGNLIEGSFTPGKTRCLLIEDVVTSGTSVVETAEVLRARGIEVTQAIIILDRGQGAGLNLQRHGIQMKALITMENLLKVLYEDEKLISSEVFQSVSEFIRENQLCDPSFDKMLHDKIISRLTSPLASKLMGVMQRKMSNLCLSADMDKWQDVLEAVEELGDKICVVKTHSDIIGLKGAKAIKEFTEKLKELATKHDFLIMEDRKFGDIGSTVKKQMESLPFAIAQWADFVTVHGIAGPGTIQGVIESRDMSKNREAAGVGVVVIAEMSSEGNISTELGSQYKQQILKVIKGHEASVLGFVSQSDVGANSRFLQFTPGVSLEGGAGGDGLGQQWNSVENVILERGADLIIVGRGILQKDRKDWSSTAEQFRSRGWNAFKQKITKE